AGTLPSSPLQRRAVLATRYRLAPDARFLGAASILHALVTGEPLVPTTATWSTDHWSITHGHDDLGTLPETPSFDDALTLLHKAAGAVRKTAVMGPPTPAGVPDFVASSASTSDVVTLLSSAESHWVSVPPDRGPAIHVATRALAEMLTQWTDLLEVA